MNASLLSASGYSSKELLGKNLFRILFPSKSGKNAQKMIEEFKRGREVSPFELPLRRKNGLLQEARWTSQNLRDRRGKLIEINLIGQSSQAGAGAGTDSALFRQDVLQVYEGFKKLRSSQTLWLEVVDEKGNVIFWNKAAEIISGYKREEVVGHDKVWEWLYPDPDYKRDVFKKALEVISGTPVTNLETTIRAKNGRKKVISWHSGNFFDESGKIGGRIAVGADITERKRIEDQERLAQKMEGLARFAAGIGHDFNNMLSIIQGYLELTLEDMDYADPHRENLLEIGDALERGGKLTSQLLSFSKAQVMEPIAFDINQSIKDMSRMIKRVLGEDTKLVLNLGENIPTISAAPNFIEQCLLNLVVNANEAMAGFGTLAISTSLTKIDYPYVHTPRLLRPGDYVLISVSDSGPGMTAEVRERIFEPFFSTREHGTGMGLSAVYGIINQHNGYIWVESEPGQGTTFNIYLPVSKKPAEQPRQKEVRTEMPHGTESILLVEDNPQMLALAAKILRRLGYIVFEANNAGEALLVLEKYPSRIDLLLTDIIMPKMNGIELARRATEMRPRLKVLYITGHPLTAASDKIVIKQKAEILLKPFPPRILAQKVREVLDRK